MVSMHPHLRQKPIKVPIKLVCTFWQVTSMGPPKVLIERPVNIHSARFSSISCCRGGTVSWMVILSGLFKAVDDDLKRSLISAGVTFTHCRQSRFVSERRTFGCMQVGLSSATTILLSSLMFIRMPNNADSQEPVNSQGAPDTNRI